MEDTATLSLGTGVINASLIEAKGHRLSDKTAKATINDLVSTFQLVSFSSRIMEWLRNGELDASYRRCVDERPLFDEMLVFLLEEWKINIRTYRKVLDDRKQSKNKETFENNFYTNNKDNIDARPYKKGKDETWEQWSNTEHPLGDEKEYIALPQNTWSLYKAVHQVLSWKTRTTYANIYEHFNSLSSGQASIGKVSANILGVLTWNTYSIHGSTHGHDDCGAAKTDKSKVLWKKGNSPESDSNYQELVLNNKQFTESDHQNLIGDHKPEWAVVFNDSIDNILEQAKNGALWSLHHQTLESAYFVYDGIAVKLLVYNMLMKEMKDKINNENKDQITQEIKDFTDAVGDKITNYYGHLGWHLSKNIIPAITINAKNEIEHIWWIGWSGKDTTIKEEPQK